MPIGNGRIGVLVAQLGTPDAPTAPALRRYLRQFLSDQRVVDYPPAIWQLILRGIILRTRPAKSAALYARIWTDEGSPLLVISEKQVAGLQERLGETYRVILGMTYGQPSIQQALERLEAEGIERIVVLPMYPQYSSTTTASVYDAVADAAFGNKSALPFRRNRWAPALRFVPPYFEHPGYIDALKTRLAEDIADFNPQKIILSFHGVPKRYVKTGDPYAEQCKRTAELVTDALALSADEWQLTFQSRFGPESWLQPYTDKTLEALGEHGTERVLVACPGFTADCLETLDEIGNEGAEEFTAAGGGELRLSPCLNDHPRWLDTMTDIVRTEAQGWVTTTNAIPQPDALVL